MAGTTAGRMRDRVKVQAASEAADAAGQPQQTWADVATVWAEVVAVAGTEFVSDDRVTAAATFKVTVRKSAATEAVTPKNRLLVATQSNRVLNVVSALPVDGRPEFVAILCTEAA